MRNQRSRIVRRCTKATTAIRKLLKRVDEEDVNWRKNEFVRI